MWNILSLLVGFATEIKFIVDMVYSCKCDWGRCMLADDCCMFLLMSTSVVAVIEWDNVLFWSACVSSRGMRGLMLVADNRNWFVQLWCVRSNLSTEELAAGNQKHVAIFAVAGFSRSHPTETVQCVVRRYCSVVDLYLFNVEFRVPSKTSWQR